MFRTALGEYLQGNWFEAEQILGQLLELRPRDVEGRLMLATLLRHNHRLQEALDQLARVELLSDARFWKQEIEVERRMIAAAYEGKELDAVEPASKQAQIQADQPQAA
jgi:cytochrome c-type biogenesis protein CcmH/NrfG